MALINIENMEDHLKVKHISSFKYTTTDSFLQNLACPTNLQPWRGSQQRKPLLLEKIILFKLVG